MSVIIDSTIYFAPPTENISMEESMTYEVLKKLDIPFARVDHLQTETIESCHEVEKLLGISICKNLFLTNSNNDEFYLLLLPGDKRFVAKDISKQVGSTRLSFASSDDMKKYLGIAPGNVSILCLLNDKNCRVKLLIDSEIINNEYIGCHPCKNTSSLKIKTNDIIEKFLPLTKHTYLIVN